MSLCFCCSSFGVVAAIGSGILFFETPPKELCPGISKRRELAMRFLNNQAAWFRWHGDGCLVLKFPDE